MGFNSGFKGLRTRLSPVRESPRGRWNKPNRLAAGHAARRCHVWTGNPGLEWTATATASYCDLEKSQWKRSMLTGFISTSQRRLTCSYCYSAVLCSTSRWPHRRACVFGILTSHWRSAGRSPELPVERKVTASLWPLTIKSRARHEGI